MEINFIKKKYSFGSNEWYKVLKKMDRNNANNCML